MSDVSEYWVSADEGEPSPELLAREAAAEELLTRAIGPNRMPK